MKFKKIVISLCLVFAGGSLMAYKDSLVLAGAALIVAGFTFGIDLFKK